MYEEYIEEKIEELKDMISNNTFSKTKCNNFISFDDLEGESSHNEISGIQREFELKAREYLGEKYPKQFAIWVDWCVHISTVELYREIMWGKGNYRDSYKNLRESRDII